MAASVCSALGIDRIDLSGKVIAIEEFHGGNGNFILSCLIADRIQKDCGICLVTLHNTFGHYHNVGIKLGYNLQQLQEKGSVETIEILKELGTSFGESENVLLKNEEDMVKNMVFVLKNKIEKLQENRMSVCILIDDISDILSLGVSVKNVLSFFQYCRTFLEIYSGLSLVVLSHVSQVDKELQLISSGVAHVADMVINISGLKTGQSSDVSGVLKVVHRHCNNSATSQEWGKQNIYHFKLLDRQVKIFAPGTAPSLV